MRERFGEVWIIDEMDGFGLDLVEKMERRFSSNTPNIAEVFQRRTNLGFEYSQQLRRWGKAMGCGKEAEVMRYMFSNGKNVWFASEIR